MGARGTGVRRVQRGKRSVWFIDFQFRDKAGRLQRYRHDATVQTSTAAHAEASRLMHLAATTGSVVDETPPAITFKAFVDGTWSTVFAPRLRPATRGRYLDLMKQAGFAEHFDHLRLDQIDGMTVRQFSAQLAIRGIQARAHLSLVSSVLRAAVDAGELARAPELPRLPKGSKRLPDCPDDEEVEAMLAVATGWLRTAIALAIYAGMRSGEVRALEVRDVDLRRGRIKICRAFSADEVLTPKDDEERSVPIAPPLRSILEQACKGKLPLARLVVNGRGETPSRQKVWNTFDALLERTELRHRSFHQLRHYFCSALLDRGVNLMAVKDAAGHSDIKTTQRYLHKLHSLEQVWQQRGNETDAATGNS